MAASLALALLLQTASPVVGRYDLVDYGSMVDPQQRIGARRTGVLCVAAGQFLWRDVRPDQHEIEQTLAAALNAADPARFVSHDRLVGDTVRGVGYRIRATLTGVTLDACARRWIFGHYFHARDVTYAGRLAVTIKWSVYSSAAQAMSFERTITSEMPLDAATDLQRDGLAVVLAANARRFVAALDEPMTAAR